MIYNIFKNVLIMSVSGGILFLLIMALRPVTMKLFRASWNYAASILTIALLIIPVGIAGKMISPFLIHSASIYKTAPALTGGGNIILIKNLSIAAEKTSTILIYLTNILTTYLPIIWLLGIAVFAGFKAYQLLLFKLNLRNTNHAVDDELMLSVLNRCKEDLGIKENIGLAVNGSTKTPMLTGLFKSVLVIPDVEIDEFELQLIFRHELIHFVRRDLWIKTAILFANAIHWFNPLVYKIAKDFDNICEISCDEKVVYSMDLDERRLYGRTILNVLSRVISKQTGICATLCESKENIKRRLSYMLNDKKVSKHVIAFSISLLVLLGTSGILTASCAQAAFPDNPDTTTTLTVSDGNTISVAGGKLTTAAAQAIPAEPVSGDAKTTAAAAAPSMPDTAESGVEMAKSALGLNDTKLKFASYGWIDADNSNDKNSYYYVSFNWIPKDTVTKDMTVKDFTIEGKTLTVAFTSDSVSYQDNEKITNFINKMVKTSLDSSSESAKAYINYLIDNGALVIKGIGNCSAVTTTSASPSLSVKFN